MHVQFNKMGFFVQKCWKLWNGKWGKNYWLPLWGPFWLQGKVQVGSMPWILEIQDSDRYINSTPSWYFNSYIYPLARILPHGFSQAFWKGIKHTLVCLHRFLLNASGSLKINIAEHVKPLCVLNSKKHIRNLL